MSVLNQCVGRGLKSITQAQMVLVDTLNQQVTGSTPVRLTTENTHYVNDFVNNLLAMIYEQNKDPKMTELLIGGVLPP